MIGIYKITNKINNQSYIGQSTDIETRWSQHIKGKSTNKDLHNDISLYGLENFIFEILEECKKEDLDKKEIYWINFYNTYPDGYNKNSGGGNSEQCVEKTRKKVYCYDLEGNFLQEYISVSEAARQVKIDSGLICRAIKTEGRTKEYQWRYKFFEKIPKYKRKTNNSKNNKGTSKPVFQFNLNKELINEFPSISEASRKTNICLSSIGMVCNGQRASAGGYYWSFKK